MDSEARRVGHIGLLDLQIRQALEKKEAAATKIAQLKAQRQKLVAQQRGIENRQRRAELNQLKYEVGGLALLAGLSGTDRGALLGGLLIIADRLQGESFFANCKQKGDALLAEREANRQARKHARQTATEPTEAEGQP